MQRHRLLLRLQLYLAHTQQTHAWCHPLLTFTQTLRSRRFRFRQPTSLPCSQGCPKEPSGKIPPLQLPGRTLYLPQGTPEPSGKILWLP